jgi:DNA polymerase III epsilon subunit-like protein
MSKYVDRYNKNDKFVMAGFNVGFDEDFLRSTFRKVQEGYFGSWFAWPKIDVAFLVALEYVKGLRLPDFKLATICAHYDIHIDAHTALGDAKASRQLFYELSYKQKEPPRIELPDDDEVPF